jgi:hypothetical protein
MFSTSRATYWGRQSATKMLRLVEKKNEGNFLIDGRNFLSLTDRQTADHHTQLKRTMTSIEEHIHQPRSRRSRSENKRREKKREETCLTNTKSTEIIPCSTLYKFSVINDNLLHYGGCYTAHICPIYRTNLLYIFEEFSPSPLYG